MTGPTQPTRILAAGALLVCVAAGCKTTQTAQPHYVAAYTPGESAPSTVVAKTVALRGPVPPSTPVRVAHGQYKIAPHDTLVVRPAAPLPGEATNLILIVDRDGAIDLGAAYGGTVRVAGLTLAAARKSVEKVSPLKNSDVALGLYQTAAACETPDPERVRVEVRAPRRRLPTEFRRAPEPEPVAPKPAPATSMAKAMPPTAEPAAPPVELTAARIEDAWPGPAPTIVIPSVSPEPGANRPRWAAGVSDTSRLRK